jgi:hypothetical protein
MNEQTIKQYDNLDVNTDMFTVTTSEPTNKNRKHSFIVTDFTDCNSIGYIFNSTGEKNVSKIIDGKIQMMQGRTYYIPIKNKEIDSDDEFSIRVLSNFADKIDVRFVKQGFACVIPLHHNTILRSGQEICTLISI